MPRLRKNKLSKPPSLAAYLKGARWAHILSSVRDRKPIIFIMVDKKGQALDTIVYELATETMDQLRPPSHTFEDEKDPAPVYGKTSTEIAEEAIAELPPEADIASLDLPEPEASEEPATELPEPELPPELPPEHPQTKEDGQELKVFDRVEFDFDGKVLKGIVTKIDEKQDAVWVKLPDGKIVRSKSGDLLSILVSN